MSVKNRLEYLKHLSNIFKSSNFTSVALSKMNVIGASDNQVIGEFTVSEQHLNSHGVLHIGLITSVIDNFTTYTIVKENALPGVTVDIHISNLSPAKLGDDIIIDAKAVRVGKVFAYLECELRNKSDNTIVAKGSQSMFVGF